MQPSQEPPSPTPASRWYLGVAIDDTAVTSIHDLMTVLDTYKVGDQVTVAVQRDGERLTVPLTLEAVS